MAEAERDRAWAVLQAEHDRLRAEHERLEAQEPPNPAGRAALVERLQAHRKQLVAWRERYGASDEPDESG